VPCSSRHTRSTQGCLTCRSRSKRCDESTEHNGGCQNCSRLRIECVQPQPWYKIEKQRAAFTKAVRAWTSVRTNRYSAVVKSLSHFPILISELATRPSVHISPALTTSETGLSATQSLSVAGPGPLSQNEGASPVTATGLPTSAPVFYGQDFAVAFPMLNASYDGDLASSLDALILAGGGAEWDSTPSGICNPISNSNAAQPEDLDAWYNQYAYSNDDA